MFNIHLLENKIKYNSFIQRFFLLLNLSNKFPAMLNIEPTNFCNFDCSFCPIKNTNRTRGFIDLKFYKKIIDQIVMEKRLKVLWLNKDGEPLMHPKIHKLVEYAKKKKAADRIEIYTNGSLLNTEMSLKLIKADLDSLVVSIDAVDSLSFKKTKKRDFYKKVVKNVDSFIDLRNKFGNNPPNRRVNKPLLSVKMVDLGKENDIKKFKKIWRDKADCVIIQKLHDWESSEKLEIGSASRRRKLEIKQRYPCNLPWMAPAINWDGKVVPCCINYNKNELIMGDIKKETLKEIFQGDKFNALRKAHLKKDFSQFPTCKGCSYWKQLPNMEAILKIK